MGWKRCREGWARRKHIPLHDHESPGESQYQNPDLLNDSSAVRHLPRKCSMGAESWGIGVRRIRLGSQLNHVRLRDRA